MGTINDLLLKNGLPSGGADVATVPMGALSKLASPTTASPSFFGQGGVGRGIAGYVGDALLNLAGQKSIYGPSVADARKNQLDLSHDLALAQFKAGLPDDTTQVKNAKAVGYIPGTPAFTKFVTDASVAPHYVTLGSPETGQTIVDPAAAMPSGPPMEAITRLKANPGEAAQFDQIFGQGAAQRALGGM